MADDTTTPPVTVAIVGTLLCHTPPSVASVSVTDEVIHMLSGPPIAAGLALTDTTMLVGQLVVPLVSAVYVMVEMPGITPVTTALLPEPETDATPGLLLPHVPPDVDEVSVVTLPTQTLSEPVIVPGAGLTVTSAVAVQPVDNVYTIVTVSGTRPVTRPLVALIEAISGLRLLHVPLNVVSMRCVVRPWHTTVLPMMGLMG